MAIKVGSRNASITVTGMDEEILLSLLDSGQGRLFRDMEAAVEDVYDNAFDGWPKDGERKYDSSRGRDTKRNRRAESRGWKVREPAPREPGTDPRGSAFDLKRETRLDIDKGEIVGRIWNDNPHSRFIKANKLGGKSVFSELLRKPWGKAGRKLAKTMGESMKDEYNG